MGHAVSDIWAKGKGMQATCDSLSAYELSSSWTHQMEGKSTRHFVEGKRIFGGQPQATQIKQSDSGHYYINAKCNAKCNVHLCHQMIAVMRLWPVCTVITRASLDHSLLFSLLDPSSLALFHLFHLFPRVHFHPLHFSHWPHKFAQLSCQVSSLQLNSSRAHL